jgi:hypothetical protein
VLLTELPDICISRNHSKFAISQLENMETTMVMYFILLSISLKA